MKMKSLELPRHAHKNSERAPAIIFVHGLSGSAMKTWGDMIRCFESDAHFADHVLDCYAFPTVLFRWPFAAPVPGLRGIAEGLRTYLEEQHGERDSITIVAHSLGGLVARQYVVTELRAGRKLRVNKLALVAVPNTGSTLANVGRLISLPHRQLKRLSQDDEALNSLNIDWEQQKVNEHLSVRYIVGGCDRAVPHDSAVLSTDRDNKSLIIDADHRSIVKPNDVNDIRYRTLRRFIKVDEAVEERLGDGDSPVIARRSADPLFDAYTQADAPFYVTRSIDRLIADALGTGHMWLIGPSGVGKTASLRHAVFQSGWRLHHINLAGYAVESSTGLFRALANELATTAKIERRLGAEVDFGECCAFLKDVLRLFPTDVTVAIVVEELPLSEGSLADFADLVGVFLENLSTDTSLYGRVLFAFSSIAKLELIKAKTREKLQVMNIGTWLTTETLQLVELLTAALRPELTVGEQRQIAMAANGSPRFVKHLFRMWRNDTAGERDLSSLLSLISKELVS